jgi:hypothetical protein
MFSANPIDRLKHGPLLAPARVIPFRHFPYSDVIESMDLAEIRTYDVLNGSCLFRREFPKETMPGKKAATFLDQRVRDITGWIYFPSNFVSVENYKDNVKKIYLDVPGWWVYHRERNRMHFVKLLTSRLNEDKVTKRKYTIDYNIEVRQVA